MRIQIAVYVIIFVSYSGINLYAMPPQKEPEGKHQKSTFMKKIKNRFSKKQSTHQEKEREQRESIKQPLSQTRAPSSPSSIPEPTDDDNALNQILKNASRDKLIFNSPPLKRRDNQQAHQLTTFSNTAPQSLKINASLNSGVTCDTSKQRTASTSDIPDQPLNETSEGQTSLDEFIALLVSKTKQATGKSQAKPKSFNSLPNIPENDRWCSDNTDGNNKSNLTATRWSPKQLRKAASTSNLPQSFKKRYDEFSRDVKENPWAALSTSIIDFKQAF